MKKFLVIATVIFCSCNKQVDMPDKNMTAQYETEADADAQLVKNLGTATLTMKLVPQVTCFSYSDRELPVPCVIRMVIICQLSDPLANGLHITLEENVSSTGITDARAWKPALGIYLVPGVRTAEIRTNIDCPSNLKLPAVYRIGSVSLRRQLH